MEGRAPTVREILGKTEGYLKERGVDAPRLSAQLLLAQALGMDRLGLVLAMDRPLTPEELDAYRPLVARRGKGEPVAYLLGEREFFGFDFKVTPDTLIPRPETELVVERALELFPQGALSRFADLGTGSGCLAVTLAVKFPRARGLALDKSPGALAVARENAARHGVADRLDFVEADFAALPETAGGYELVVSNPPYVSVAEYRECSREVRDFEPSTALVPGETGLEAVPVVARAAFSRLAPGGRLLVEIGWKQGPGASALLAEAGFADVAVRRDLAGCDRVVEGRKPD
ncbi:peptide chain release factor N(5)-glutamine methyltransferase [Solidesulfovibrio sp.]|uniref:peptide chain release factor N(5)-glutamine methyltransferase n=1 Tax=Solidesulfovibrio sp. TaxID=2910990 RepID=UPI002607728B|nr:peptide chain release factor N(5)-glutamine methyltransferase [Solidesulfovibrio sp.]